MPISVQCSSCKAKLNVPDKFAGKKVKCPKCGQGISTPGGPAAAPKQVPATGDQRSKPAPPRLPLLSFDDLKVPKRLRKSIENEVEDEEIVWMGRPTPGSLLRSAKIGMWVGIVMTLLVGGGMGFALVKLSGTEALIAAGVGGFVLLTMGLPMATMPIWVKKLINYRDCYVLTRTRAIVFDNEKILWATAKPYTPDELRRREMKVGKNGEGSIIFGYEEVKVGMRTRVDTEEYKTPRGKVEETEITMEQHTANKPVGFMDIAEVEAVEALLCQTLGLEPKRSHRKR